MLSEECDALYADAEQSAELASALCAAIRADGSSAVGFDEMGEVV